jgi:hypothetical protein
VTPYLPPRTKTASDRSRDPYRRENDQKQYAQNSEQRAPLIVPIGVVWLLRPRAVREESRHGDEKNHQD